jgi:N-succinyl-L-ornithine transcarbamylase
MKHGPIEYEDQTIMEGLRSEHVKEAAQVVSQYCDVVGIRAFATLTDKEKDESEQVLRSLSNMRAFPS